MTNHRAGLSKRGARLEALCGVLLSMACAEMFA